MENQCCSDRSGTRQTEPSPFTKLEDRKELLSWANLIKQHLPISATIYNGLLSHGQDLSSHLTFYTLNSNPDSHIIMWQKKDEPCNICLFCREEEVPLLTEVLKTTSLINWRNFVRVFCAPTYLVEPVREIGLHFNNLMRSGPHYTYTYNPHLDNQMLKCPAGYKVCRLGLSGVRQLLEKSRYNKNDPVEDFCRYAKRMPCLGVYPDPSVTKDTLLDLDNITYAGEEEVPVSWVASSNYGTIGMLGTDDGHRRKGLGTLVVTALARLQVQQGFIPHVHVDDENAPSQSLFDRAQGWVNTHLDTWVFTDVNEMRGHTCCGYK